MVTRWKLRPGGLMRCCVATLEQTMGTGDDPKEGDELLCVYCKNLGGGMVFKDGAWEWKGELDRDE
jgi:hypothetical protein